ncbi:Two component system histidine kinase [Sesbania bispinosa]|nr:Two component system histidine kinase [Sesbania bispinosa]
MLKCNMQRGGGVVVRRLSDREIGGNGGRNQEMVSVQGGSCVWPAERRWRGGPTTPPSLILYGRE